MTLSANTHLNEHGGLTYGRYCKTCGKSIGNYSGDHREDAECKWNPEFVKKLERINEAGSIEIYTFNKLKGEYDNTKRRYSDDRFKYFTISETDFWREMEPMCVEAPGPPELAWTKMNTGWNKKRGRK